MFWMSTSFLLKFQFHMRHLYVRMPSQDRWYRASLQQTKICHQLGKGFPSNCHLRLPTNQISQSMTTEGQELSEHQRLRFPYRPSKTLLPVLFSSFYHSVSQEESICQCRYTFKQGTIADLFKYYDFANHFLSTQILCFLEDV